ncbi:MAG: hypothetical protein ACRC8M_08215 [Cetobacterium sp.]|uniref:hypothetical protein n=1 Tax=Cetobacterium sp. TaxID=2071632 RepID=UPI003F404C10
MKKLALLLGSLLVVGATASAKEAVVAPVEVSKEVVVVAEPVAQEIVVFEEKPLLRVTSFGMWTENDNNAGSSDGDIGLTYLAADIGLASASGNWTYAVQGYKAWKLDSDEGVLDGQDNERFQLDAWRHFNRNEDFRYSLGARARLQNNYDRYYARGKYSYGFTSGWVDLRYQSNNGTPGTADVQSIEIMPLNITMGPITLGYFFYGDETIGNTTDSVAEHQLRAYFPLFASGKFSSDAEVRLGLKKDAKNEKALAKNEESDYDFGDLQRYGINTNYKYSENLSFNVSYLYEIVKYSTEAKKSYYGEFVAGWNYKF